MCDDPVECAENEDDYQELLIWHRVFMSFVIELGQSEDEAFEKLSGRVGKCLAEKVRRYHRTRVLELPGESTETQLIKGIGAVEAWYPGPSPSDVYWPKLRAHLANHRTKPLSDSDLVELDRSSSLVLASCQSPWKKESDGRGLVVGYVQSGKTTNFTAVMAKAADMGFRLIVVLSGTTSSLRKQTQDRLNEQLFGPDEFTFLCHTESGGDLGSSTRWTNLLHHKGLRNCVVVKKNVRRLKNLNAALDFAQERRLLDDCPILVIDDEGDQASLSPACDPAKATAINEQIVRLLARPRVSYVAYTATPFANCFVNANYHENLFPRDFIIGLPEPAGYFGSRKLFGVDGLPEVFAVSDIPESEASGYFQLPPPDVSHLREAIQWFLMAATVRRLRNGGVQPHTTMLVNVSERIDTHTAYWLIVRDILRELAVGIRRNDARLREIMAEQWSEETFLVDPADFGYEVQSFDEIWDELSLTLDLLGSLDAAGPGSDPDCGIVIDNSRSAYRLVYDDEVTRPVIVVGGNTLSRGLTLEGLVSSFFMRSSRTYDTLLQMGRWFGFRGGYEDLFRVWMSSEIKRRFEFLARVELELREWIGVFATTGLTPLQFGPRIRMHPLMQITRVAMLKSAVTEKLDLSGSQPETSLFENTTEATARHRDATVRLASRVLDEDAGEVTDSAHIFRNVDASVIMDFFDPTSGFQVIGHSYLTSEKLRQYITNKVRVGELGSWNVVFRRIKGGKGVDFLPGIEATFSSRSRKSLISGIIDIGSLAASSDRTIDLPAARIGEGARYRRDEALLVIYVIDKDSVADQRAKNYGRVDLEAVDHLIGVALFLPISNFDHRLGDFVVPGGVNPWDEIGDDFDPEPDPDADDENDARDKDVDGMMVAD